MIGHKQRSYSFSNYDSINCKRMYYDYSNEASTKYTHARINTDVGDCSAYAKHDDQPKLKSSMNISELNRINEQKLSNIDRINSKIKKILDTLNEEENKITKNLGHQLKIKEQDSRSIRIKTEGDQYSRFEPVRQGISSKEYSKEYSTIKDQDV